MKVKTLALTLLFLIVLVVCLQTPIAGAIPPPTPPPPAELLWADPKGTNDIALSKDGQYVAAVRPLVDSGELAFYGRSSGTPIWTWIYKLRGSLSSVAISYDGSCVAAGGGEVDLGYVFFWNNAKSRTPGDTDPTWTSVDLGGPIEYRCLAMSDDGNYVVAGGTGTNVFYWANAKSSDPSPVSPTWTSGLPGLVEAVDMSSDGNYVAAGYETDVAYWKNARSLGPGSVSPAWLSTYPDDHIVDVAVSDDGNYVAAAGMLGASPVYYWANAKSLTDDPTTTWESASGVDFSSIDMSSNGDKVIAGALGPYPEYHGVYFWAGARTRSGTEDWSWNYTTAGPVHDVAINDAGDYMAAANGFPTPYVYFFDSAGDLKWTYEILEEAHLLSISSDGGTLAIGTGAITSRFLVSTGYRTPSARPVGGILIAVDKLTLLSPWIAVALAAVALTVFATKRRRKL